MATLLSALGWAEEASSPALQLLTLNVPLRLRVCKAARRDLLELMLDAGDCADLPKRIKQKAIPVPAAAIVEQPLQAAPRVAQGGHGGRGGPSAAQRDSAQRGAPRGRRYSAATGRGRGPPQT